MLIKILLTVVLLSIPIKPELIEPELIEPELIEFKKDNFVSLRETINQDQATRLNLSLDNFTRLIQNDWWLYAEDILLHNAADKIVSIFCSFDNFDETTTVNTLLGDVIIKYSACPIINYPLQISFPTLNFSEDKKSEFMDTHINFMKKYF